eukprot:2806830-Amphidinium_carterae.1
MARPVRGCTALPGTSQSLERGRAIRSPTLMSGINWLPGRATLTDLVCQPWNSIEASCMLSVSARACCPSSYRADAPKRKRKCPAANPCTHVGACMHAVSRAHTAGMDKGLALRGAGAFVLAIRSRIASALRNNKDMLISPPAMF